MNKINKNCLVTDKSASFAHPWVSILYFLCVCTCPFSKHCSVGLHAPPEELLQTFSTRAAPSDSALSGSVWQNHQAPPHLVHRPTDLPLTYFHLLFSGSFISAPTVSVSAVCQTNPEIMWEIFWHQLCGSQTHRTSCEPKDSRFRWVGWGWGIIFTFYGETDLFLLEDSVSANKLHPREQEADMKTGPCQVVGGWGCHTSRLGGGCFLGENCEYYSTIAKLYFQDSKVKPIFCFHMKWKILLFFQSRR